ncbi:Hypothetical predicted protein, partial [Mytilus galloprovincialis]
MYIDGLKRAGLTLLCNMHQIQDVVYYYQDTVEVLVKKMIVRLRVCQLTLNLREIDLFLRSYEKCMNISR